VSRVYIFSFSTPFSHFLYAKCRLIHQSLRLTSTLKIERYPYTFTKIDFVAIVGFQIEFLKSLESEWLRLTQCLAHPTDVRLYLTRKKKCIYIKSIRSNMVEESILDSGYVWINLLWALREGEKGRKKGF